MHTSRGLFSSRLAPECNDEISHVTLFIYVCFELQTFLNTRRHCLPNKRILMRISFSCGSQPGFIIYVVQLSSMFENPHRMDNAVNQASSLQSKQRLVWLL